MLRSSQQLWQSCNCAKIVIGRQLDRKDWSATWKSKRKTPNQQPQQANKQSPQVLTNLWKGETGETDSRSHYLVHKTLREPRLSQPFQQLVENAKTSVMTLYLAAHRRPVMHHSCLPSSSNENTNNTRQSVGAHKHIIYMCLKKNHPGTPASNDWEADKTMQPSSGK